MRPILLAVGQGNTGTGYSRVLSSLLSRLSSNFEIIHFALNYTGSATYSEYSVIPCLYFGDLLGSKQFPEVLSETNPDIILICHDLYLYAVYKPVLDMYKISHPKTVVIIYCPVEWSTTFSSQLKTLASADVLVFFTEFGLNVFWNAMNSIGFKPKCRTAIIPHGVDTTQFYPLCEGDRKSSLHQARAHLFPGRTDIRDAFIVLNANRNIKRKRVDLTLRAFSHFLNVRSDAYLYLHMGMLDYGCDILETAKSLGIRRNLLLTTENEERPVVDDAWLNLIYNACDVGINTSMAEGWGLVAFEHAAVGAPQLLPAHSACLEIWAGCGVILPVYGGEKMLLDLKQVATEIEKLSATPALCFELGQRHLEIARNPAYSWDSVADQWASLLAEAM